MVFDVSGTLGSFLVSLGPSMKPARILVFIDSLAAGGAERQTVELVTRLDRSRFLPAVVSLHGPRMHQSRHFVQRLLDSGITVVELDRRWSPSELPSSLLGILRCLREFRPDLVHSVSHHCNHLTRVARLLWPGRFRLLTAIRTAYDARQLRNERLEQWLSSFVVCNSPDMAVKLRSSVGVRDSRLRYIPNGLDTARFGSNPDPGLRSRLAPGVERVGVMLARITHQKSPDLLARAVGRLEWAGLFRPGHQIWIVGEPECPIVQSRLDDAIKGGGLDGRIRIFPQTLDPAAFLHAADFSVLASLWEGTPNAALESLAAGKPVLISEKANASGLIRDAIEGWSVPTGDEEALAEKLRSVLDMPLSNIRAMATACRSKAAEFDMPLMVRRYEELYTSMLGLS